jgi:Ser/Thr protein kinase RdoA (MazF antagonist)
MPPSLAATTANRDWLSALRKASGQQAAGRWMMSGMQAPDGAPSPAAVLAAFGVRGRPTAMVPVPGAWSNRVYRLTTDRGSYAVKELRNPWREPRWLDWLNAAWQFEQAALAAGIAMPEPVASPAGGCVAWVIQPGRTEPVPIRMHAWVDGIAPGPGPVTVPTARWAGGTLATLHRLRIRPADRSMFPRPDTATADDWADLVTGARLAGASWADQLQAARPAVAEVARLARTAGHEHRDEVMTHGDIDQKNIVLGADGPVLCDWDVAAPMVPVRELADVALSLAGWERREIAREVLRAYRAAGGEVPRFRACDLGQSLMSLADWIAFNVGRAIGTRPAEAAEAALGNQLVPGLLAQLPRQLDLARRADEFLAV